MARLGEGQHRHRPGNAGRAATENRLEKADRLGTAFLAASSSQKVSPEISKNLDYNLSPDEVTKVKYRLAELRLRFATYRVGAIPADESSRRRLFAFAKAVDIEMIVTSAAPAALPELDRLAGEFGVNVAFEGSNPNTLMSSLEGLSSRMGVSADTAAWARAGIKAGDGLRLVNARLLSLGLTDAAAGPEQVLLEWARLNPLPAPPPITCGDCSALRAAGRPLFVTITVSSALASFSLPQSLPAVGTATL